MSIARGLGCRLATTTSVAFLIVASGAGCGDSTDSTGGGGAGGEGPGGQGDQGGEGGRGPETLTVGGDRPVVVQIPSGYDPGSPAPLLILLHGYGASGSLQEAYFQLGSEAEARGVVYAFPDGTADQMGSDFWNASDACCDFYATGVDDSAYLIGLVDEIGSHLSIDPKRVYFVGHSNGAFMSYRMACDHAARVAAIVGLAGAMPLDASSCAASEPVSVLAIHGTADDTVPYDGGLLFTKDIPSAPETVGDWAEIDGCGSVSVDGAPFDFEPLIDGAETTPSTFPDCAAGAEVTLWTIEGGGHVPALPGSFAAMVFDFLLAHPKP